MHRVPDALKQNAQKRRINTKNEYSQLAKLLGLQTYMDKILIDDVTMLRLALTYIQSKRFVEKYEIPFKIEDSPKEITSYPSFNFSTMEQIFLSKSNIGFLVLTTISGECLFVSPWIEEFVGVPVIDFIGQHIFKYIHPMDTCELEQLFKADAPNFSLNFRPTYYTKSSNPPISHSCSPLSQIPQNERTCKSREVIKDVNVNVRIKCSISGRKFCYKSSTHTYKTVNFIGKIIKTSNSTDSSEFFIGMGIPLFGPTIQRFPLSTFALVSKNQLNMSFLWYNQKLLKMFQFNEYNTQQQSLYRFVHMCDQKRFRTLHSEVLKKHHAISSQIRIKTRENFIICTLRAHLVFDYTNKPNHIICIYQPIRPYNPSYSEPKTTDLAISELNHNLKFSNEYDFLRNIACIFTQPKKTKYCSDDINCNVNYIPNMYLTENSNLRLGNTRQQENQSIICI